MMPVQSITNVLANWVANVRVEALAARVESRWHSKATFKPLRFGRYSLDRVLGSGSFGVVFAGFDLVLEREVAIKVFHSHGRHALTEARMIARVQHPNVVNAYDVVRFRGLDAVVMQLVGGTSLRRARAALTLEESIRVLIQAGLGLAAIHDFELVHGDIKPSNILVASPTAVWVADLGLAQLAGLAEGYRTAGGTRAYLAPEARAGAPLSAWTDQFAFCVMAWELVFRRPLWRDEDGRVCEPTVYPRMDEAPDGIVAVLRRGLVSNPRDRHPSMADLVAALEATTASHAQTRRRVS